MCAGELPFATTFTVSIAHLDASSLKIDLSGETMIDKWSMFFVLALVLAPICTGCDRSSERDGFVVAHVDHQNVEVSPRSEKFPFFGDAELPEGASLSTVRDVYTVTHPDKDVLVSLFDGKVPDTHWIGYEEYSSSNNAKSPDKRWRAYYLRRTPVLSAKHVAKAEALVLMPENLPYVGVELTKEGRERFAQFTRDNIGHRVAIIVDDEIQSVPVISGPVSKGKLMITQDPDVSLEKAFDETERLAQVIREVAGSTDGIRE